MFVLYLHFLSISVHSSGSGRISPPASEFDLEGVGIIDLALDKYSKKKADSSAVTDKDLITKEALTHNPEQRGRDPGSVSSVGSVNSTSVPDPEATAGSYGAMLRNYTKRNKPQGSAGVSVEGYVPDNQQSGGNGEGGENHRDGYDLNLALSLNYEVSFVLYMLYQSQQIHARVYWAIVCMCTCSTDVQLCFTHVSPCSGCEQTLA